MSLCGRLCGKMPGRKGCTYSTLASAQVCERAWAARVRGLGSRQRNGPPFRVQGGGARGGQVPAAAGRKAGGEAAALSARTLAARMGVRACVHTCTLSLRRYQGQVAGGSAKAQKRARVLGLRSARPHVARLQHEGTDASLASGAPSRIDLRACGMPRQNPARTECLRCGRRGHTVAECKAADRELAADAPPADRVAAAPSLFASETLKRATQLGPWDVDVRPRVGSQAAAAAAAPAAAGAGAAAAVTVTVAVRPKKKVKRKHETSKRLAYATVASITRLSDVLPPSGHLMGLAGYSSSSSSGGDVVKGAAATPPAKEEPTDDSGAAHAVH